MKKLIKSKKGGAEVVPGAFTSDPVSVIVFICLLVIFAVLFLISSCANTAQSEQNLNSIKESIDLNYQAVSLLRTPAHIQSLNLADIAEISLFDSQYDSVIKNIMALAFQGHKYYYGLRISKGGISKDFGDKSAFSGASSKIILPSQDFGTVEFMLWRSEK